MDKSEEKRQFHRVIYDAEAHLSGPELNTNCRVVDLSLKGCLLHFEQSWSSPIEDIYTLTLNLADDITITMELSVSHVIDTEVGFKCEHIDIDSISQLRRLVELNLGDNELLERDLLALSGKNMAAE